ncbi:hypothetical protein N0V90_012562 [Kalmusia sp. IMI 367209]|nr:hypothetical protein N0V90_012562 [Kalmusia sp. IMI 367209]
MALFAATPSSCGNNLGILYKNKVNLAETEAMSAQAPRGYEEGFGDASNSTRLHGIVSIPNTVRRE